MHLRTTIVVHRDDGRTATETLRSIELLCNTKYGDRQVTVHDEIHWAYSELGPGTADHGRPFSSNVR